MKKLLIAIAIGLMIGAPVFADQGFAIRARYPDGSRYICNRMDIDSTGISCLTLITTMYKFLVNLKVGSTGYDVRLLQTYLNTTGATLTVDGGYGPKLKQVLAVYQTAHNLSADGLFGPNTRAYVNNIGIQIGDTYTDHGKGGIVERWTGVYDSTKIKPIYEGDHISTPNWPNGIVRYGAAKFQFGGTLTEYIGFYIERDDDHTTLLFKDYGNGDPSQWSTIIQ